MKNPIVIWALSCAIALPVCANAQGFNGAMPNAPEQTPAFKGQTRAKIIDSSAQLQQRVIASGLVDPWGMDVLPEGGWIVTERGGRMRIIRPDGHISAPISGILDVDTRGQGGLLDVAVRDDFADTRRVWWSFAEPRGNGRNSTSVATGTLSADGTKMGDVRVIFRQEPGWASSAHFGSRLVFDNDGALFVTTGDRSNPEPRRLAQDVSTHIGKIVRIDPDGGPAYGNPSIAGALPEIWSWGHRNLQSAALDGKGRLWTVEHGPRGGDELNRPKPAVNHGWPVITYGRDYSGAPIGSGLTAQSGMEQPIYYWDPSIAPSGMAFYEGAMFPDWNGSILMGALAGRALVRLQLDGDKVSGEARYFQGQNRIRDVDVMPDGSVVMLTDGRNGALVRVTPAN